MITAELLATIRVLYRAPDTLALYGIPYEMRPGQAPRNIREDLRGAWIWLGSPGWWGSLERDEQQAISIYLESWADWVPENPCEFSCISSLTPATDP